MIQPNIPKGNTVICVGSVNDAYHMQGLVKIKTFTAKSENICNLKCHYEDGSNIVIKKGPSANTYRIEGVNTRTEAEKLVGTKIYTYKEDLPELESDGEFYMDDLIGLPVVDMQDSNIGEVKGCFNFGAGDILEISFTKGKNEMILFTHENFPEVSKHVVKLSSNPRYSELS
jgi:16S rRNA processing protein RimM